jgi:hypothetical protein
MERHMAVNEEVNADLYKEIPVEEEDTGNLVIENPFNPAEINIKVESPTIFNLIDRLKQNPPEIDLYTDFQRKDNLWDAGKQSRLIESILIKLPLPAFYFDGTDDNKWLVVDGLQRLSSLRNFMIEKTLKLTGLEFLKDLDEIGYDDLPRSLKRTIDTTQITAYIINPGTPAKVKYNIFKRINTGGLVLEPQEIRHALNQGIPAKFVADLASSRYFKMATEFKIDTSRMMDREFATRFLAFFLTSPEKYAPDLDSFLNNAMAEVGKMSEIDREKIKIAFDKSMDAAHKIFGVWAFRKADRYPDRRKPISKAIFEVWSVVLAKMIDSDREKFISKRETVMSRFADLCHPNTDFWKSITSGTGEKSRVIKRFSEIQTFITEIVND